MRLRRQLALVSLLTLSLPWAGCQYLREIESSLRQGQMQSLEATAQAVAAYVQSNTELVDLLAHTSWYDFASEQLYVHELARDIIVDGYDDDWRGLPIAARQFSTVGGTHRLSVLLGRKRGNTKSSLYLFLKVVDPRVVMFNPAEHPLVNGDHVRLSLQEDGGKKTEYVIRSGAPGRVYGYYQDAQGAVRQQSQISGVWQAHPDGFQLELELAADLVSGRLAVNYQDEDLPGRGIGNRETAAVSDLIWPAVEFTDATNIFAREDLVVRLVSSNQWALASSGQLVAKSERPRHGWLTWLQQALFSDEALPGYSASSDVFTGQWRSVESDAARMGYSESGWYRWRDNRVGRVALPIAVDQEILRDTYPVVVVEQSSERMLALTQGAFKRLLYVSLLATLFSVVGLLAYASVLSFRIGRLSRAVDEAIDDSGRVSTLFPESSSNDELGYLSRRYAALLKRLGEYTNYLRTLSDTLSHELRTPLAIMRSSLDNLSQQSLSEDAAIYAQRAMKGGERLSNILNAMSAANRIEDSIEQAEKEPVRFDHLLREVFNAYRDSLSNRQLQLHIDSNCDHELLLAPDLVVQMLDKLVDNAVDFCNDEGTIDLYLRRQGSGWVLGVSNDGPLLPEAMAQHLFDPLVSIRERKGSVESPHLGLGLQIVRLIADFHGASVTARNRVDKSGVVFEVLFPGE